MKSADILDVIPSEEISVFLQSVFKTSTATGAPKPTTEATPKTASVYKNIPHPSPPPQSVLYL
jgi:hypothetical protein